MEVLPFEWLLNNLDDTYEPDCMEFCTKDQALDGLRAMTGQDFGYDVAKWKAWFAEHPEDT